METPDARNARLLAAHAHFVKFKKRGRTSKPGSRARTLHGHEYEIDLLPASDALLLEADLAKKYGTALAAAVLGYVRYTARRQVVDDFGRATEVRATYDVDRGEGLIMQATQHFVDELDPEDYVGLFRRLMPTVRRRQGDVDVTVMEIAPCDHRTAEGPFGGGVVPIAGGGSRDLRTLKGEPAGFDAWYAGRTAAAREVLVWALSENVGDFIFGLLSPPPSGAPQAATDEPESAPSGGSSPG